MSSFYSFYISTFSMPPPNLLERAIDEAIMMKEKAEPEHEKEKKKKCSDDAADFVTAAAMGCKSGMPMIH
jgi:hypothetical protein